MCLFAEAEKSREGMLRKLFGMQSELSRP